MSSEFGLYLVCSHIAEEGKKMLSWVLGVFRNRSRLTLYKSMVRSKLEYCCPLWSPSAVSDILKLEKVQRVFTSKWVYVEIYHTGRG